MKVLEKFADKHGLIVRKVTFGSHGIRIKRKGFDLIRPSDRVILATFEPTFYTDYKWFIHLGKSKNSHVKRVTSAHLEQIDVNTTDYIFKAI